MPHLEFDPKFSIGNVITVGMLIVSLVIGWGALTSSVTSNAQEIQQVSTRVSVLETGLAALIRELASEKVDQARILTQLQTDMSYTRVAVEKLERTSRGE
jgi:hypothetical protein